MNNRSVQPDLNQMSIFAAVVEAGTFTAAAKALGMPKSTVSKRISELEDRLGCRLLHRTTRRVKLTAVGCSYHAECQRIVADARAADRTVAARDGSLQGIVRVTAPWLLAEIVAPAMHRFLRENENVSLEVWITNRVVDLIEEGVDLAIRPGSLTDSSLVARRLGEVEHCICASPDYLERHRTVTKPSDLRTHACIAFGRMGTKRTWSFERDGKKTLVAVNGRYAVTSGALMHRAALAGLGIASVPKFVVEDDLASGRLVRLLENWTTGRGAVHLVYPSGRHLSPAVRGLLDVLVSTFGNNPPWSPRERNRKTGRREGI
ncbi:LysR family transcriptional regulator [Pendulispora rubella]|uniref:LysR family transcriptional regulator n=1 Tax=Pendulispora rubella TaxID=2741070 RepID=UPI0030E59EBD